MKFDTKDPVLYEAIVMAVLAVVLASVFVERVNHFIKHPDPPHAVSECHAEETATVVCERRLGECLDTLRIAKRVVTRYEDGANVCRTMGGIEDE